VVIVLLLAVAGFGCGNRDGSATTTTTSVVVGPTATVPTTTITPATTSPTTSPPTTVPTTGGAQVQQLRILRPDGIGPFDFGVEMSVVVPWATEALGAPVVGGLPESVVPNLVGACPNQELVRWPAAALDLYFSEWEVVDDALVCTGTMRLVAWGVGSYLGEGASTASASVPLATQDGIGVGTTVAELIDRDADPTFMQWSDELVFPAGFYLGDPVPWEHLFGVLTWDWVRDLQAALNEHGFELVVDGEVGPMTLAAVDAYQVQRGLPSIEAAILDLALKPRGDVRVASLASGLWFLEFECGTLYPYGFGTC
jgi:hypothetical protein